MLLGKAKNAFCIDTHSLSCRVDHSETHAYEARQQFATEVQKGESGINLAVAALAVRMTAAFWDLKQPRTSWNWGLEGG